MGWRRRSRKAQLAGWATSVARGGDDTVSRMIVNAGAMIGPESGAAMDEELRLTPKSVMLTQLTVGTNA